MAVMLFQILNAKRLLQWLGLGDTRDAHQPFPTSTKIIKIPPRLTYYELLCGGAVGWVYRIDCRIVLKYPVRPNSDGFNREMAFFDILEKHEPCPHIVQSFLRVSDGIFLAFMGGGSLHHRLETHQRRSADGRRVEQVVSTEPHYLVKQWLMELCKAAAWLESLGYVHGDIRPPNLLLDNQDHLKLADFDCVQLIGTSLEGGAAAPWARVLGAEYGSEEGSFGTCGPRTEQFAIGSILYCLTRGHEPYEMDHFDDDAEKVTLFKHMMFPPLSDSHFDTIIERSWKGEFARLKNLSEEANSLCFEKDQPRSASLTVEYCSDIRRECQSLVDRGLLVFT
ncbi:AGC protein kinase [Blastomyces gilchristii SLH14081]|uniref:AGC protein kinase n=1 Tax=Blastomyces gilchristii (strain SLH14081) TaxID=559298 RepID=A0A179V2A1_BLAGS|nr:AGC protein kinase [Blastomyces gilchristii SLH14081]OAT13451.1 AGC protein kinase [Blastomyces gilchristii SLH14081]